MFRRLFGGEPRPGKPVNISDEEFETEVLRSEIPVAVDFWSSTCAPCQVMAGLLSELGPQLVGLVKIVKVRVDRHAQAATRFGVRGVPTVMLFKDGKVVDSIVGLLPLNPLREKLEHLAGGSGEQEA